MNIIMQWGKNDPQSDPLKFIGALKYKVIIKRDYRRADGTSALYLRLFQKGKKKKIPLQLAVPPKDFDDKTGRIKPSFKFAADYNLIIEKKLAELNKILVGYRLSDQLPKIGQVVDDLSSPGLRANFNAFADHILQNQKEYLKASTYRQQKGALSKIKKFQDPIYFNSIDSNFLRDLKLYCKNSLKNGPATIASTVKNFKKYLHMANDQGIRTPLSYKDIGVPRMLGSRTFLMPEELKLLFEYYNSKFINPTHHLVLKRYLFSCFTGIRLSDNERITADNFIGDYLAFTMHKTNKFIRIKLNKTALSLVHLPEVFPDTFTREHINRELKTIARILGIKKRLYFHSSRHTFATNFLISGGDVVNLQRILGHSKIDETMIYVHIVEAITDRQIDLLDDIIK